MNEEYLKNEEWRCEKSPMGAHFWKGNGKLVCVFCEKEKDTPKIRIEEMNPGDYKRWIETLKD